MRRTWTASVLAAAFVCSWRPGGAQQTPVFRSGVDLVTVDVTVLDGKGNPIEGIAAERFHVTVDGTPRRVVWAEFVRHRATPIAAASPADHFVTNEGAEPGRVILVAVDPMHIRRVEGLAALRAAGNFIDALDRSDRVAATRLNDPAPLEFTTDHAAVKRQLQRFTGAASFMPTHFKIGLVESLAIADGSRTVLDQVVTRECGQTLGRFENLGRLAENNATRDPCPVQVEQEGRALAQQTRTETRITLDAIAKLLLRLAEIEGPKAVVLLSEGLVAEPQLIDLSSLGAAAEAARVTLHVLQLETPVVEAATDAVSPTLYRDIQLRADGLARLAGSARGGLFRLVGDDPYPFRRIVRELSAHYLVAFEPVPEDRDGRSHRIQVQVRADGAQLRARPSFRIAPSAAARAVEAELVRALREPRTLTELPVRSAAYAFREPAGEKLHVLISAEVERSPGNPEPTAGFVLVDSRGVIAASGGGVTEEGRFVHPISIQAGRYTLKAAAIDPGGRRGSVERTIDMQVAAASDLMIAEAPGTRGDTLRPVVIRTGAERVIVYLEMYGTALNGVKATVDIEREGGGTAGAFPAHIETLPGRVALTADVPLAKLGSGTYIATMTVIVPAGQPHTSTRRFVVVK